MQYIGLNKCFFPRWPQESTPEVVSRGGFNKDDPWDEKRRVGSESYCVGLAEVLEYFEAGKLVMVKE